MGITWLEPIWVVVAQEPSKVARRQVKDVEHFSSEQELIDEAKRRGVHVARIGEHYFIAHDKIDVKC